MVFLGYALTKDTLCFPKPVYDLAQKQHSHVLYTPIDDEDQTMSQSRPVPFVFVNEDENSKGFSRSEKRYVIQRQVQRWRAHSKRKLKTEALLAGSAPARRVAQLGWTTREPSQEEEPDDAMCKPLVRKGMIGSQQHQERPLFAANFCKGDSLDPFHCVPVRLDHEINLMLQHYRDHSILTTFSDKIIIRQTAQDSSAQSPILALFQDCMHNPLHMYSLLTVTAAIMNQLSRPPQRTLDYYMQAAIRELRAYLKSNTKEAVVTQHVVLDIVWLAYAECQRQNYEAALTHLRVLSHLKRVLDVSNAFDAYVYEMLCDTDLCIAAGTGSRLLFPDACERSSMSTYQKELINSKVRLTKEHQRTIFLYKPQSDAESQQPTPSELTTARVLTEAVHKGFFGPEMRGMMSDVAHLTHVALNGYLPKQAEEAGIVWIAKEANDLLHRLLSSPDICHGTALLSQGQADSCRLAAIITLSHLSSTSITKRTSKTNMKRLKEALTDIDHTWGSTTADRLLLWTLATGLFAAVDTEEEAWFRKRAERAADELEIPDYQELQRSLQLCVHHITVCCKTGEQT